MYYISLLNFEYQLFRIVMWNIFNNQGVTISVIVLFLTRLCICIEFTKSSVQEFNKIADFGNPETPSPLKSEYVGNWSPHPLIMANVMDSP